MNPAQTANLTKTLNADDKKKEEKKYEDEIVIPEGVTGAKAEKLRHK